MKIIFEYSDGSAVETYLHDDSTREENGRFCALLSTSYVNRYIVADGNNIGPFTNSDDLYNELQDELNEFTKKIPQHLTERFYWIYQRHAHKLWKKFYFPDGVVV